MEQSQTASMSFESVEQLDDVVHGLGWDTEYRQLEGGPFSSTFHLLEGETWFMLEEQSGRSVEVVAPSPEGMFVLALAQGHDGAVNGHVLTSEHIFVQSPDSEFRATLPADLRATQIGVPSDQFEAVIDAVAPGLIRTPWTADWGPLHDAMEVRAPLGRSGEPADIAEAVADVAAAAYLTGQVVVVDGGFTLR